ncbi:hypothetical protein KP509_23G045500 [Ceratopteris richardii]|uniref:Leucine-rich repeat-containing N-terminal plant-type domain-containing protein n=1 Tax=Ceratopteris richardii TaxID=49495 RepID=A0A8T2S139_CERRI|nr:hypothetical protein KP509_23G045500 [Ceratopteris richardii]
MRSWQDMALYARDCGLPMALSFLLMSCFVAQSIVQLNVDEQLYEGDFEALRAVRSSLADLPGSFFFDSWEFDRSADRPVYPCTSFMGLICDYDDGVLRVRQLNLGTGLAGSPGLVGILHPAIANLTALQQLTVAPGQVGGQLPASLAALQQLRFLGISQNHLSGPIPAALATLPLLQTLDLSFNDLWGPMPHDLLHLPALQAILLSHNRIDGSLPAAIRSPLVHLDMQSNLLSGQLPESLPHTLSYLSLAQNQLSGSLLPFHNPPPSLYFVDVSYNNITGFLPPALLGLALHSLLLHHNRLWGLVYPLSPVLIENLDLSFNDFSGPVSRFLSTAARLYLNNNRFIGRLSEAFISHLAGGELQLLYLQHNLITEIELEPEVSLPLTASFCIAFNCMETPPQSQCPDNGVWTGYVDNDECGHL